MKEELTDIQLAQAIQLCFETYLKESDLRRKVEFLLALQQFSHRLLCLSIRDPKKLVLD